MPTLVTHVKSNIGNGLLSWFLENECDYFNDSLSLLLLKGAKIPLQVANVTDDALAKKAETFLKGYDAAYAVFDNDLNLPDAEKDFSHPWLMIMKMTTKKFLIEQKRLLHQKEVKFYNY